MRVDQFHAYGSPNAKRLFNIKDHDEWPKEGHSACVLGSHLAFLYLRWL